jgi:hypothetical protein
MAPNTAYAGGTFENDDLLTWVELDIRSGRGEAIPTCTSASALYTFKHGDVDVLLCLHPRTIGAVCEKRAARLAFAVSNLVTRSFPPHGVVALNGDR